MSNPFDNLKPKYNYTVSSQPTINVVSFGDGFEQRLTKGLNQNPITLNFKFDLKQIKLYCNNGAKFSFSQLVIFSDSLSSQSSSNLLCI